MTRRESIDRWWSQKRWPTKLVLVCSLITAALALIAILLLTNHSPVANGFLLVVLIAAVLTFALPFVFTGIEKRMELDEIVQRVREEDEANGISD